MTPKAKQKAWIQFACAALTGLTPAYRLEEVEGFDQYPRAEKLAEKAFIVADEMMEQLNKLEGGVH